MTVPLAAKGNPPLSDSLLLQSLLKSLLLLELGSELCPCSLDFKFADGQNFYKTLYILAQQ